MTKCGAAFTESVTIQPMGTRRGGSRRWVLGVLLGCVALLVSASSAFAAAGTGKITGLVKEAAPLHKVIANVGVEVLEASSRKFVASSRTNEFGEYKVEHLAPGSYKVEFLPAHGSIYAPQFYDEKASFSEATPIALAEGETKNEINAELHEGGTVSGTVTNTSKVGLEGVEVVAFTGEGEEFVGGYAFTEAGGKYSIRGLAKGSYTVEFFPESGSELNYVPQYYNEVSFLKEATPVSILEGETKTEINAKLQEGGKISGRVTDAYTHKPLAEVFVSAYSVSGSEEGFGSFAITNANGEYTIFGLGNGTYKVEFESEFEARVEYITQYYNGQPTLGSANLVTVTQGSTTPGINAALVPKAPVDTGGPVVSGTPAVGQALTCANGSWTGEPKPTFTHTWLRNGSPIAGAALSTYVVQSADQGSGLACKVTAKNAHGTASATSNTLSVPPVPPPPPPPNPIIELTSSKLVVSGNSAQVPIVCAGATCAGTIELTERVVIKHRHGRKTKKTLVLGRATYALAAGHGATIIVRLTSTGRHALATAKHHRLSAKLSATVIGGLTKSTSVVLSEPAPKHKHGRR